MPFRLNTFGSVSLRREDVPLAGRATQRRRVALLILLAASGRRGLSRETIIGRLWPDRRPESARHALSQALYAIRQELGGDALVAGIDELRLDSDIVSSDIAELWEAVATGDHRGVVAARSGPFLEGFFVPDAPEFERWAEEERARVDRACGAALEALAAEAVAAGDADSAAEWWRRRASLDRLDARVALRLMEALVAAGDRAGAVRHSRVHAALLERELQLPPDPQVDGLARRIASEPTAAERVRPSRAPAPAADPPAADPPAADPADPPAAPLAGSPRGLPRRLPRALRAGEAALLLVLVSVLVAVLVAVAQRAPADAAATPRSVILGSIRGGDASLVMAVEEALRAELQSTPELRVVSDSRLREVLQLMRHPPDAPVALADAVEAGQRMGVALAVGGSVGRLGGGLQLVADLVDVRTGRVIATLAERPTGDDEVIPAVTRLARELRRQVTGAPADESLQPLPAVSTTSLPALKSYALARHALARLDRQEAIELAEAALVHDSLFAMAHYLVGDLLWFVDQNRHAEEHLRRAYELSAELATRERLVVRARYEQLVRDRPDSALAHWRLLARTHPEEALGWEGMRWAYRALAEWEPMAAAAESAYLRDPNLLPYYAEDRIRVLASAGDTAAALALARSLEGHVSWPTDREAIYWWAVERGEWEALLRILAPTDHYRRQVVFLATGRLEEGRRELEGLRHRPWMQALPRAILLQALAEATEGGGSTAEARGLAREALEWIQDADLSPPAYARLAERVADVGARAGDAALVADAVAYLRRLDAGRELRSYVHALRTAEACGALLAGRPAAAARLASEARESMFYGRSMATVLMLEADARAAAGDRAGADSLYRLVLTPEAFPDGDEQTLAVLQRYAGRVLEEASGTPVVENDRGRPGGDR